MTNIVILTRNRPRLIEQTLNSLYDHTPHDAFNCVVIDDGSDDFRALKFLRSFRAPNFSLVEVENSGHVLSQLKNLGVYWSEQKFGRGEWLCVADNDCYFMEWWLEKMIHAAERGGKLRFEIFGGQAHPFHEHVSNLLDFREYECLAGTHWFMPWSTWDTSGPYDRTTAAGVCQSEDFAFTQRIRATGGRIGVTVPFCVADCGVTQTDGTISPGGGLKFYNKVPGVYYE